MGLFGDDLPRTADDIPSLDGDPAAIRSCAADLRLLAGELSSAWTAANQLSLIRDGTSWQGAGFDAFRTEVEKNPRPADVENAQAAMSSAAAGLDTLAAGLADCQSRIAWCRQRIDALGLTDGDIPDDVRPLVDAIKADADDARGDHDGHLRTAGETFDELTSSVRYADPPGFFGMVARAFDKMVELNVEFAIGIVEGVWEMAKGVYAIGAILVQPHKWDDALRTLDQIIQYAVEDPGGFLKTMGQAIVDWDTRMSNPARWAGKLVPAILLAIVTGGAGSVAAGAGRIAAVASRLGRLSRLAGKLDDVAGMARQVDRVVNLADRSGLTRVAARGRTTALASARTLLPPPLRTATRAPGAGTGGTTQPAALTTAADPEATDAGPGPADTSPVGTDSDISIGTDGDTPSTTTTADLSGSDGDTSTTLATEADADGAGTTTLPNHGDATGADLSTTHADPGDTAGPTTQQTDLGETGGTEPAALPNDHAGEPTPHTDRGDAGGPATVHADRGDAGGAQPAALPNDQAGGPTTVHTDWGDGGGTATVHGDRGDVGGSSSAGVRGGHAGGGETTGARRSGGRAGGRRAGGRRGAACGAGGRRRAASGRRARPGGCATAGAWRWWADRSVDGRWATSTSSGG